MNRLKSATLAVIRTAQELYAPSEMARITTFNRLTTPYTSIMGCMVNMQPCQKCIDTIQGGHCKHALKVTKEAATFVLGLK